MIRQFDIFTDSWLHNRVKDQLLDPWFDWNFPTFGNPTTNLKEACFGRCALNLRENIVNWNRVESLTYVFDRWIDQNKDWFQLDQLDRCLINLYAKGQQTAWHNDNHFKIPDMYSLLYYVDDGSGGTEFTNQKFLHKENTGIFFDSNLQHRPIASMKPRRISVSWVMKGTIK
jgi:hypothetical protein